MADMEIWKDIEGFEGKYQVSNMGRVRSLDRYIKGFNHGKEHLRLIKGRILAIQTETHGYSQVQLHYGDRNKVKSVLVHKLVAIAFIPNPENKPCVDHISTVKTDNRVENLRWVSYKENANNPISLEHYRTCHI